MLEPLGLSGGIPSGYGSRRFNCDTVHPEYQIVLNASEPIDWNCNRTLEQSPIHADVNGESLIPFKFTIGEILTPRDDWGTINFTGGLIGKGEESPPLPISTPANELTPEEATKNEALVLTVSISIKPDELNSSINSNSKGRIPVAILSNATLEAVKQVDRNSLTFGRTGLERSLVLCNRDGEDVNNDGRLDLVCHFDAQRSGLLAGDMLAILKGEQANGRPIIGTASVRMVK